MFLTLLCRNSIENRGKTNRKRKETPTNCGRFFCCDIKTEDGFTSVLIAHLGEALAAVNGTIALGLEGNLGLATASGANSSEVLTGTASSILASVTAGLAALGLVLEAALCVELLLAGGEHELATALFAH